MDGKEVIISNQEKSKKRISNLLQNGVISWINKNVQSVSEAQSEESVLLDDSQAATQPIITQPLSVSIRLNFLRAKVQQIYQLPTS